MLTAMTLALLRRTNIPRSTKKDPKDTIDRVFFKNIDCSITFGRMEYSKYICIRYSYAYHLRQHTGTVHTRPPLKQTIQDSISYIWKPLLCSLFEVSYVFPFQAFNMDIPVMQAAMVRIGFSEQAAQALVEDQGISTLEEISSASGHGPHWVL